MRRRDFSQALFATAAGSGAVAQRAEAQTCTAPCYAQTAAETAAGVTPTNYAIPADVSGYVDPQRYGFTSSDLTGSTNTTAFNNACLVATRAGCMVKLPGGVFIVTNLLFGTNSTTGQSSSPRGLIGGGGGALGTILRMYSMASGTCLAAKGLEGVSFRDFTVDGNTVASVCIDTSWPTTVGANALNVYDNVWAEHYTVNGWLAINDNQSKFSNVVIANGAVNYALSGLRLEGSGGSIFLDNVTVSDAFLSITCQDAQILGGYFFGLRVNESQSGTNVLSISGGTQIYANPVTTSHFEDSHYSVSGYSITTLACVGIDLLGNGANPVNTINCGIGLKVSFRNCHFGSSGGTWQLYGTQATAKSTAPAVVECEGTILNGVTLNTPSTFITILKDSYASGTQPLLSDNPTRVVYRGTHTFTSALTSGTWTTTSTGSIPADSMSESFACYKVCIAVNLPAVDNIALQADVQSVPKNGAVAASTVLNASTSANNANTTAGGNTISVRYAAAVNLSGTYFSGLDFSSNVTWPSGTVLDVILLRTCNPAIAY